MKYLSLIILFAVTVSITACTPEIGSDKWCAKQKEKDKGDWSPAETKDYTKHCIF